MTLPRQLSEDSQANGFCGPLAGITTGVGLDAEGRLPVVIGVHGAVEAAGPKPTLCVQVRDDATPLGDSVLRVTPESDGDGMFLVLEHEQLLAADFTQYGPGWPPYRDRLRDRGPSFDRSAHDGEMKPHYEESPRNS